MKRGYRRRLAAIAAVGAILLLAVVTSACSGGNDEIVDLLEDRKFGLAHLSDELETLEQMLADLSQQVESLQSEKAKETIIGGLQEASESEKILETIIGGLEEASATLVLRGVLIGIKHATQNHLINLRFQVTNASRSGEPVNLSDTGINAAIVTYIDTVQTVNVAAANWSATWLTGSGNLLNPGETVEIDVDISGLSTLLTTNKRFTIQIKPTVGATLLI